MVQAGCDNRVYRSLVMEVVVSVNQKLDDVARENELAVARRWEGEPGVQYAVSGLRKPYARFILT